MFVGREKELNLLENAFALPQSNLVVIYGRRRIGKSSLVMKFLENKPYFYVFEAIETNSTLEQIKHFTSCLKKQKSDPLLSHASFKTWEDIFTYITERIIKRKSKKKMIIFLDEIQWMAMGRSKLISLLKYYWDNAWKNKNIMVILCGSIASFMVDKVLSSKSLYGRINLEILLQGLKPSEAYQIFQEKKSREEILKYLLFFGTVPKYLEEIDMDRSLSQNINRLCFSSHGIMLSEVERTFYNQFQETQTYLKIVHFLRDGVYALQEISKKLGISSGGSLKHYLENLERAEIIRSYIPFDKGIRSKFRKYVLCDEYLRFYFKYLEPNRKGIQENHSARLFELLTRESLDIFLGLAFEKFCIKHASYLADIMGFADEVIQAAPYFGRNDNKFQIDLLYLRADKVVTLCEIKYHNKEITTKIIPEVERKSSLLKIPRGYSLEKALISLYGPDEHLQNARYFQHYVTLQDVLPSKR